MYEQQGNVVSIVCMHACMCVYVHVCVCTCARVCMCACVRVCMGACVNVRMCVHHVCRSVMRACMYVCVHVCMCLCPSVYYIYIYIRILSKKISGKQSESPLSSEGVKNERP